MQHRGGFLTNPAGSSCAVLQTALEAYILVWMDTKPHVPEHNDELLTRDESAPSMARKYVWWQPPERTLTDRPLFLAQMMNLGTADDLRWLLSLVSDSELREVLRDPPVGIFNPRSWSFWHLRLGLTPTPELPVRRLPPEIPR